MGHTVNKFSLITYNAEVKKWDTKKLYIRTLKSYIKVESRTRIHFGIIGTDLDRIGQGDCVQSHICHWSMVNCLSLFQLLYYTQREKVYVFVTIPRIYCFFLIKKAWTKTLRTLLMKRKQTLTYWIGNTYINIYSHNLCKMQVFKLVFNS